MNIKKTASRLMLVCLVASIATNSYARRRKNRNWSRRKKVFVGLIVGGALGAGIGAGIGAGAASCCCCSKIGIAAGSGAAIGAVAGTAIGASRSDDSRQENHDQYQPQENYQQKP